MIKLGHDVRGWATAVLLLIVCLLPQRAWGANSNDEDDTVLIDGVTYHVLRNSDDWTRFIEMVRKAKGKEDVNAIMDDDITISTSVGSYEGSPYRGIFNGNGYTLNLELLNDQTAYMAPFLKAKDYTIKNLRVTGYATGGIHTSGLVGSSGGTNHINNCWVSVTVNTSSTHAGGLVGHGGKGTHYIDNCLFDGTMTTSVTSGTRIAGAIMGWEDGGTSNVITNTLENATYSGFSRTGFSYNASNGGSVYGCSTVNVNNWSYHNWGEMKGNVVGTQTASQMVAQLGSDDWQIVNNKVVPKMVVYELKPNIEFYDIIPGVEEGDEGTVKVPFSCDNVVKWIEVSYTDEYGNKKNLGRTTLPQNSYSGYLKLPATESHRNMALTIKFIMGRTSKVLYADGKGDAQIHNPRLLKGDIMSFVPKAEGSVQPSITDAGAVMLRWTTKNMACNDLIDGDAFLIQRTLTGQTADYEEVASVAFNSKDSVYEFKDSTFIDALPAELIDSETGIPLVRYRVYRAATQELWGMAKNPTVAYVQPQMATLLLLEPTEAKADWSNETERKVKVKWNYKPSDNGHNYVWDSRAAMKLEVMSFRRDGSMADSIVTKLTEEQMADRQMEVQLTRSCVTYQMRLIVDGGTSPIGKGEGQLFTLIKSNDDYVAYRDRYNANTLTSRQNAILMANVTSPTNSSMLGTNEHPFAHNFNGNGYTLTYTNTWAGEWRAIVQHATDGAVLTYLKAAGKFYHDCRYAASLVSNLHTGSLFIENCYSNASIEPVGTIWYTNSRTGGLVGLVGSTDKDRSAALRISNSQFDGQFTGGGRWSSMVGWREQDNFAMISNSYYSGNYGTAKDLGNTTFMFSDDGNHWWDIIEDTYYKNALGTTQGKKSETAPDNWCWENGMPKMEQKKFSPLVSGSKVAVTLPSSKFYYENVGKIDPTSLKMETRQSSVVLTWKNVDDNPVDYYEVWRRDILTKDSVCIATQLVEMQYEDRTTSPVHSYVYKVLAATNCEGTSFTYTPWKEGQCQQTAKVSGYLRFDDGTGIPGQPINITLTDHGISETVYTDESGYFVKSGLPYFDSTETTYSVMPGITGYSKGAMPVTFGVRPGENTVSNVVFVFDKSVKFSGYVQYNGTSIPVQGVSFIVDGREVHNSSGKVLSDHEGKFSFRMLPDMAHSIRAVKDGHLFYQNGYYHEDDDTTKVEYNFSTDKAGIYFYDNTRVKLIGRVAGGKDQGAIPLGNSLSKNNLGNDLQMVFVLEGDNASRLVWDIQDTKKKERKEEFEHKAHDKNYRYMTSVHTTLNRMVVKPDVHTGEYEVWLPPVKWKIQQITAQGYATLFQEGKTGDVIDLSDSIHVHRDHYEGIWKNANGDDVTQVDVEYYAQYSRIYHTPVIIDYKQMVYDNFEYLGDRYYNASNLKGENVTVPLAYGVRKKDWPADKADSLETVYSFGYPVFDIERSYPIKISAVEKYYYNNDIKNDTVDVVRLSGGEVTIHNGMLSSTHREVVKLDSVGEALYDLKAKQVPYMLTGKEALRTVTMTLLMDGTYYEAKPLQAYILNLYNMAGAKDVLSISKPQLIDVLRDPPGGGSSAKLSKGTTLKYSYNLDWSVKGGLNLSWSFGAKQMMFTGVSIGVGSAAVTGFVQGADTGYPLDVSLVVSGKGKKAWSYTMTTTADISTSSESTMVGADADVYIGTVTNITMKPAIAIRALPHDMFKTLKGQMAAGRLVEIATGRDKNGDTLHLVRDEVLSYGPSKVSTFMHSQKYITDQLLPALAHQCASLLFFGSEDQARQKAKQTGQPVYMSLLQPDDDGFALMNTTLGDGTGDYLYNSTANRNSNAKSYLIVLPDDTKDEKVDSIKVFCESMMEWMRLIAQNESEKLAATDLVKNFDIDGGSGLSYSESFKSEVSVSEEFKFPWEGSSDIKLLGNLATFISKSIGKLFDKGGTKVSAATDANNGNEAGMVFNTTWGFLNTQFKIVPVLEFNTDRTNGMTKTLDRKESFTISMDKKSHLIVDVYRVSTKTADVAADSNGDYDVFVNSKFDELTTEAKDKVETLYKKLSTITTRQSDLKSYKGFVYRTRGGATCRPYEGERKTKYYNPGTLLDERTKKIENPVIKMDKQSISGVPFDQPARFKVYMANESEMPEAIYPYFDLYMVENANPKGAKMMIDGMPLSGNARTIEIRPGQVTEKTLEVYASEDFDYEKLKLRLMSVKDVNTYQEVEFDVHYLQTAGSVAISTPGDKWIMNCDAPYEANKGWYMPVVISGFNKNQKNFDHIEFQYKESTRGDDYWTNLCGYYNDSTLYAAASGTKEMIPENGNIITRFFGEGTVMEKAYDLRAVLFCRNGNGFLTNSSKVLSGVKDTRRPQLFGTPEPKDGILGAGDNIIFNFSEGIEYNYLQATTNFEVKGETNETSIQEAPALQFDGHGYAQSEARRNFANKSVTIEVMIKPDDVDEEMPIFSHGRDGRQLQLWLTKRKTLKAVVDTVVLETDTIINTTGFQRVALVLDNKLKRLSLFSKNLDAQMDSVTYSGYGPLVFGSTQQTDVSMRKFFKGRMLQGRVWNRVMDINLLNTYGNQLLTGYEMGLTDYYPMNEGKGDYATDLAQGAHLMLHGANWARPRGMSLKLDRNEQREVKGLRLKEQFFQRSSEQDYTLMFWFKTKEQSGTLLCNGSGKKTDVQAENKFFIGFEGNKLKYRSNGEEYALGNAFNDDEWHHYAMTVNRAHQVASIYVDNDMKAQFATDSLGGMLGQFYLGNMVWQEEGVYNDVVHQQNALTGYLDGIAVFEQALPISLIKRYTAKSIGGSEKGLITYVEFDRQERQKNGDITLQPYVLNKKATYDKAGKQTDEHDSVFVDPIQYIMEHVDRNTGAPMQAFEELRNLNFSYVGRDHQLLVNIDELDSRINKRTVYVTVNDIPDLNGNYTASPATMAVFVDRNPLRWTQKTFKATVQANEYQDIVFDINIVNNSGESHTYTVTNMPKWLSVNTMTDVIEPKSELTLTFTIGHDINAGSYDDIIYLTDENGLFEPLALNITIEAVPPAWLLDENMKQFSMNIVARVQIGDDIVSDSHDMVGVFDEAERCMGLGNVNYDASSSESLVYLTVCDSTTTKKKLRFKLWHYETGKVMILTPSKTIEFKSEGFEGTTKHPIVLKATDQYVQTIDLWPGWNWISLNVLNNDYRDLKTLLSKFPWENNDQLTDETHNLSLLYHDGEWIANKGSSKLSDHRLRVSYSYRVKVNNHIEIQLEGSAVKTEGDRTINVKSGWNSIGYTPMVNLPIATALADYLDEAEDGDVVKSKTSFAMFSKGANGSREWKGNLKYLRPGEGYMLYRTREGAVQFTYPFFEANATFFEESSQAPMMWEDYISNMVMTATADGIDLQEGDKLIAYSGAEIRGESVVSTSPADRDGLFYLTIAGHQQAPLSFAIEREGDIIATTGEVMTYQTDAVSGSPEAPTRISFVRSSQLPQDGWYTLQGIKLQKRPTQSGVYIYNGKKQVIK